MPASDLITDLIKPGHDVFDQIPLLNGPAEATLARRAKSYSDFYDAATSFLEKQPKTAKVKDRLEAFLIKSKPRTRHVQFDIFEDRLLHASHEEFRYVHLK